MLVASNGRSSGTGLGMGGRMTTHLTKIWWDLNKHKLVEQAIPEAEIYKREWIGLTDEERNNLWREVVGWGDPSHDDEDLMKAIEAKLKEKNA